MKNLIILVLFSILMVGPLSVYAACKSATKKPNTIYRDIGDGTVIDNETGLIWQKCSLGFSNMVNCTGASSSSSVSWKAAFEAVQGANSGAGILGQKDWRLPNVKELASLVDKNCIQPAINSSIFPDLGTGVEEYWSSTIDVQTGLESQALYVRFDSGSVQSASKNTTFQVRMVRGGY